MGRQQYDLFVAEDRARQANEFLRQALSVLYPLHPAYPHIRAAQLIVEREWIAARAALDGPLDRLTESAARAAIEGAPEGL